LSWKKVLSNEELQIGDEVRYQKSDGSFSFSNYVIESIEGNRVTLKLPEREKELRKNYKLLPNVVVDIGKVLKIY